MAEIPSKNANCQRCGAPLAADAPEGLCPRCLMALNLATQTDVPTGEPGSTAKGAKSENTPPLAEIAKNFPQLEILECLGRGGMGVVYKARQPRLNRLVALKILAREREQDPHFAERFEREAQALARMNHPNIVTVHDFGQAGGLYYLIMEFVDGMNLRDLLRSRKMAPEEALTVVPPICEALQYAHQQGIVHRDIKPENILLDKQGRVKIADFGIAKILGAESQQRPLTGEKQVMGTPHYMAPEQVEKPATVDHRADIYSLGVVFYEMLTGELPLGKFAPPSHKVHVDVRLDEIVLRALEKEPALRYQQVSEVKTQVETIATGGAHRSGVTSQRPEGRGKTEVIHARFSRTAIVGAVWAPLFFMVAFSYFWATRPIMVPASEQPPGPAWWQIVLMFTLLPLGFAAPFGTTILGWISVAQIRRSAGRLYGLGLAVFDGLVFPLLALDAVLLTLGANFVRVVSRPPGTPFKDEIFTTGGVAVVLLCLLLVVVSDWLICRAVWRAVNKPINGLPPQPTHPSTEPGKGKMAYTPLALAAFGLSALSGSLGIAAFCLFPNPPPILVWSILGAALLGIFLGVQTRNTRFGKQAIFVGSINTAIWLVVLLAVNLLPHRATETTAAFGPVREQFITDAFDLDSGTSYDSTGAAPPNSPKEAAYHRWDWLINSNGLDWMTNCGADLLTVSDGLIGHAAIVTLKEKDWETMTLPELQNRLQFATVTFFAPLNGVTPYGFQTREGSIGILQETRLSENPPGVKIRYKLLQDKDRRPPAGLLSGAKGEPDEVLRKILTDFPYGIWNKPLQHYARNRRPDSWFALINLPPAEDSWVSPVAEATGRAALGLPADAPGEQIAAKAGSGDLYVPDLDHLVPVRGTRLAPLKYKKLPDDWAAENQATFLKALEYTTREQIAEAIKSYDAAHSEDKWVRLEEGGRYGALRPDGQLLLITAFGSGDGKSVQLIPIGKIGDAVPTKINGSSSALPAFGPTIERVLPFGEPCRKKFFQFHTGNVIAIGDGPGDTSDHAAEYKRAEETGGLDASALGLSNDTETEKGIQFAGHGCVFVASDKPEDWKVLTAEKIIQRLQYESWLKGVIEVYEKDFPATYLFRTARGECGILQITGLTDEKPYPSGMRLRYKLAQGGPASILPGRTEQKQFGPREGISSEKTFGPTIERVLNDPDDDTHNSFLDLDSGTLADCPVPWPPPGSSIQFIVGFASGMGDSYKRAVREKKFDLQGDASGHSVLALDMVTASVANEQFEKLSAAAIATNSALSAAPQEGAVLNGTNVPATWLFKTHEGGKGVLQIVSFNDKEPRSAKIRYKLVQSEERTGTVSGAVQRHPQKEETYTITSVLQVLKPANPEDMQDDFQEVRVLAQDNDSYTVEVTYYPLFQPAIGENPDWRKQTEKMADYVKPMPAANWDEAMQRDLIADLKKAGIEPEHLTDRQLVERVARWALDRAHKTDAFSIWCVDFQDGKPRVFPPLRDAFEHEKHDKTRTDDQMFEQEVLGRSMFYNRTHGSCTSYSVYLATILRALGIPTRIVFCIPPFDPNDETQAQMLYGAIHHNEVREAIRAALDGTSGFENHLFNEVYVGGHWERLNYARLGQPILDRHYFGLLTHIYSCSDLSDVPLAQTWGMRYFHYPADQPKLSSVNPYRLISVADHFGANANLSNPPVPPVELQKVAIIGLYGNDAPEVPEVFKKSWSEMASRPDVPDFLIAIKEWLPNAPNQMRALQGRIGRKFVLKAPGHPQIRAHLTQLDMSSGGNFQAFGAQIDAEDKPKLVPGAAYSIEPINISDTYRWLVASNVALVLPSPTNSAAGAGVIEAGPLIARDVTLNFADPTLSDESFHTKRPTSFDFDLHDPSNQGGFAVTSMLIGQTEFMVSVMKGPVGTRVEVNDLNKKTFLDEVWNNRTNHFEKVVTLPVDYNQKHYSCPVKIKFGREKGGPLWGEYRFCAYLTGRVNLGGSEKKFELVSSDPRILFRGTNDGKPFESLGIDLNNDGRIDPGPDGGESFKFDETFAAGSKHYHLSEADASSLVVVFQEVTEPDYVKAQEILKQIFGIWGALQHTIEKKDDLKLAQSLASQSLDQLHAYNQLVRGTPVEFSQTNILDEVAKIIDALKAGKWDEVEALENADSGGTNEALDTEKLDALAAVQSARAFGPVLERTLPLKWKTGTPYCLDFESGKLVAPPGRLTSVDLGWDQWCAQSGVDAMAEEPRSGSVIWGQRCVFSKVDAGRWKTIKPDRVVKELLEGRNTTMQAEVPNRQAVPAVFLFKTREENRGVLQIIGFSENPRGVKIRYKLVEKTAAAP